MRRTGNQQDKRKGEGEKGQELSGSDHEVKLLSRVLFHLLETGAVVGSCRCRLSLHRGNGGAKIFRKTF